MRGRELRGANYSESLSHNPIPKLAAPRLDGWGEILRFVQNENLPGAYPYTGGVYPYRREEEDPTRMFAGEGAPERTNRRFHYLASGHEATRLSTAFDSTTLYGEDPDLRPDIFGRTGNSGVSIATLDDMKKLYSGFDLCKPSTSVSMTINGPAPMILAMFMNTAIDQRVERHLRGAGRWPEVEAALDARGNRPAGISGRSAARPRWQRSRVAGRERPQTRGARRARRRGVCNVARRGAEPVRGTVQADILKEDQAQNTCIFSTEFALRMMGDVQQFFSENGVRNFYSVSISGYHIAEAGANPITQLAFTLANGFTIVEYYLARGMKIDDFAPNLSFFFSNGMDAEYAVIGRVARRIWARAMKDIYKAGPRSQMLKYHIQTSGRSLHAREIQFNDIRTTLQAMYALFDNCNSLHTNAYDEALTTPTEESVRRAVAIQLIINRELGLNKIQNPWAGSYAIEALTDLVEEAVYKEFESLAERGGVLGAMETMYQRGKIQEESLLYETRKHDGSLPIVGVNTFLNERDAGGEHAAAPLFRASDEEQRAQVDAVRTFQARHARESPEALRRLQEIAAERRQRLCRTARDRAGVLAGRDHARALPGRRPVPPPHVASRARELVDLGDRRPGARDAVAEEEVVHPCRELAAAATGPVVQKRRRQAARQAHQEIGEQVTGCAIPEIHARQAHDDGDQCRRHQQPSRQTTPRGTSALRTPAASPASAGSSSTGRV